MPAAVPRASMTTAVTSTVAAATVPATASMAPSASAATFAERITESAAQIGRVLRRGRHSGDFALCDELAVAHREQVRVPVGTRDLAGAPSRTVDGTQPRPFHGGGHPCDRWAPC